ncbi:GAF and ANTAR domain-containing protein [Amycolatopsis anabasis]|uniref:GAF and ANTAR domain-containing protein n=1 Tax=Amycolatopsis anabasis TaxID=1840409 RepID=UPI00131B2896|nr:GAF and ANTAR domain-containing protein [Amycolatopsis anabasis]
MAGGRRERLLGLLDARGGDSISLLRRVCALCLAEVSVSGAAVSVRGGTRANGNQALVCGTDPLSALLDDLRMTVGEGPSVEAFDSGGPVLVPDLAADGARWPGFTSGALAAGIAAVFSFPLQVGVVRVGVLDLYRTTAGPLSRRELTDALLLAEIATQALLDDLRGADPMDVGWLSDIHAVVHQASGIVAVQLRLSMQEALLRIRGHAFAHHIPLNEVARQIVARELRLETGRIET